MESNGYCEVLVKVKASKTEETSQRVLWLSSWVLLALDIFLLFGTGRANAILWILWLAALIGALVLKRKMSVEYEYQYLDGSLRVDKVIAMKKRKKAGRYELDNLYLMAPEGDERLAPYQNREGMKQVDYSSHDQTAPNRYQLVFQSELVTFEPTENMVRQIWRAAPSKVVRKRAAVG